MQVDPIKPSLIAPGTKLLKLKYETLLSSIGFDFNLRRYTEGAVGVAGGRLPERQAHHRHSQSPRVHALVDAGVGQEHYGRALPNKIK